MQRRRRQAQVSAAAEDDYRIGPNLWTGISTVRAGAGTAIVGSPQQVAATLQEFIAAGCTEFCLSGYPHDQAALDFGELVMPYSQTASKGRPPNLRARHKATIAAIEGRGCDA